METPVPGHLGCPGAELRRGPHEFRSKLPLSPQDKRKGPAENGELSRGTRGLDGGDSSPSTAPTFRGHLPLLLESCPDRPRSGPLAGAPLSVRNSPGTQPSAGSDRSTRVVSGSQVHRNRPSGQRKPACWSPPPQPHSGPQRSLGEGGAWGGEAAAALPPAPCPVPAGRARRTARLTPSAVSGSMEEDGEPSCSREQTLWGLHTRVPRGPGPDRLLSWASARGFPASPASHGRPLCTCWAGGAARVPGACCARAGSQASKQEVTSPAHPRPPPAPRGAPPRPTGS